MREEQNSEQVRKILVSAFYLIVGLSFFNVNMIAGDIISTAAYSMAELEVKSPAAINLIEISNSPANPGNRLTYVFRFCQFHQVQDFHNLQLYQNTHRFYICLLFLLFEKSR